MRRILYIAAAVVLIPLVTYALSKLKPAAPSVDRATVWTDTVKRGPMDLQVRGLGTLVPQEIQWIPAITDGQVERRLVFPGTAVKAQTVLMVLANPQLQQQVLNADWQVKEAEAKYNSLKSQLESQVLDQRATAASVKSDYLQAKLQAERDHQMADLGLGPKLAAQLSEAKAEAETTRKQIESDRVSVLQDSAQAQLAAQKAKIEEL